MSSQEEEGGKISSTKEDELLSSLGQKSNEGPEDSARDILAKEAKRKMHKKELKKDKKKIELETEGDRRIRKGSGNYEKARTKFTSHHYRTRSLDIWLYRSACANLVNSIKGSQDGHPSYRQEPPLPEVEPRFQKQQCSRVRRAKRMARRKPVMLPSVVAYESRTGPSGTKQQEDSKAPKRPRAKKETLPERLRKIAKEGHTTPSQIGGVAHKSLLFRF